MNFADSAHRLCKSFDTENIYLGSLEILDISDMQALRYGLIDARPRCRSDSFIRQECLQLVNHLVLSPNEQKRYSFAAE